MSRPINPAHWINRRIEDLSVPVNDELFEAINHRPQPGKDVSNLSFNQYLIEMQKEQPMLALDLYLKLGRLRLQKRQEDLKNEILADDRFTMAEKQLQIKFVFTQLQRNEEQPIRLPKQRITDEVADHVRELAQTTNNISQISRLYRISRGSVQKILKNRQQ